MKCNDFPGVVYSRLIAFGKKRENKTHGKISQYTVEKEINPRCKFTKFVILDFSQIFYSEKPILKVNILMTGMIQ